MREANGTRKSLAARQSQALQSMVPGTIGGRVGSARPVPRRNRQVTVRPEPDEYPKVLLIENGGTVPPDTPYGTIIVEKSA